MYSPTLASRAGPSYGIRYVSAFKHVKPIPISPAIAVKRGLQDFNVIKYINHGDSGSVYLARDVNTAKEIALKIIPKDKTKEDNAVNEQNVQRSIETKESAVLLPLMMSFHDNKNFYIATEYMAGGDMALELARSGSFNEERARFYGAEMIVAVEQLQRDRIIHRDIKPSNILIDARGHIRLADFGFAKKFEAPQGYEELDSPDASFSFDVDANCESGSFFTEVPAPKFTTNERVGTPHFMSPQRSAGKEYDDKEDLWSVGITLYVMMTGRLPFGAGMTDSFEIGWSVQHETLQFQGTDLLSDAAKLLLIGMLSKDTRTRLTIEQVKSHQFFHGLDWVKVANRGYDAPWIPFVPSLAKIATSSPPDVFGSPYDDWLDPLPFFNYTSTALALPEAKKPIALIKNEATPLKKFGSSVAKLFTTPKKVAPAVPSAPVKPKAIQPVLVQPYHPTTGKAANVLVERAPTSGGDILDDIDAFLQDISADIQERKRSSIPYSELAKPRYMEEEELAVFREPSTVPTSTPVKPQAALIQVPKDQLPPVRYTDEPPAYSLESPHPKSPIVEHVATIPEPCSVVVEVWEERNEKKDETPERVREFAGSYEPWGGVDLFEDLEETKVENLASPPSTPCPSPTPTLKAPVTPVGSPTPTLVGDSPELSAFEFPTRAAKRRIAQKQQAKKFVAILAASKLQQDDVPVTPTKAPKANVDEKRLSWDSPAALRPPPTPPKIDEDDRYTRLPVRKHRAALHARALAMQASSDDDLGPLPIPAFTLNKETEPVEEVSVANSPTPTPAPTSAPHIQETEENGKKTTIGNLFDSIRAYMKKVFGPSEKGHRSIPLST